MFKVDNLTFKFFYEDYPVESKLHGKIIQKITWCRVFDKDQKNNADILVLQVPVICYYKDQYDKAVARKQALGRTLKIMGARYHLTKAERTQIWNEYFRVSPKSKR